MAVKKYPHAVIFNGVFYPANTEIEVKEEKETRETAKKSTVKTKETAVDSDDKGDSRKS